MKRTGLITRLFTDNQWTVLSVEIDQQRISTIRLLSVEMVQKANSRHPGLPPVAGAWFAVELGISQGFDRYTGAHGDMLGVERFGASALAAVALREDCFTVHNVCAIQDAAGLDLRPSDTAPSASLIVAVRTETAVR